MKMNKRSRSDTDSDTDIEVIYDSSHLNNSTHSSDDSDEEECKIISQPNVIQCLDINTDDFSNQSTTSAPISPYKVANPSTSSFSSVEQVGSSSPLNHSTPKHNGIFYKFSSPSSLETAKKDLFNKNKKKKQNRVNYSPYLNCILQMLEVDQHTKNNILNDTDRIFIKKYITLTNRDQEVFVRMLQRKLTWVNKENINMSDFEPSEMNIVLNNLEREGFISKDIFVEDLDVILNLLSLPQLKRLSKDFKLNDNARKEILIGNLKNQVNSHKSIYNYFSSSNQEESPLKKKALELCGTCFIIRTPILETFYRIILLFSYPHYQRIKQNENVSITSHRVQNELYRWHNFKKGFECYPITQTSFAMSPFNKRDDLIRYEKALQMHDQMKDFDKSNPPDQAIELTLNIKDLFITQLQDNEIRNYFSSLPLYLRRYSAGSEYAYILFNYGIKFLKKKNPLHPEIVLILLILIDQSLFMSHRKVDFYEELFLYWSKGKQFSQLADDLIKSTNDPDMNLIQKQILFISWQDRLINKKNILDKHKKEELKNNVFFNNNITGFPHRTFHAVLMADGKSGSKSVYKRFNNSTQETTFLDVESFALKEYHCTENFVGKHCEIRGVQTLFILFFWDIIYDQSQIGVFRSMFQQKPLDIRTGEFYLNRKKEIDERLEMMQKWGETEVRLCVQARYNDYQDLISLVDWRLFNSTEEILEILKCMGMKVFSKICERLAQYYNDVTSGFPDLLLYNSKTKKCKFVEVKGPRDTLSSKQILWLKYLLSIDADCEICYVESNEGLKRKRK